MIDAHTFMQFKALTIKSKQGRFFELISKVGVSPPVRDHDEEKYAMPTFWTNCLWDTGAAYSAITKEAVDALNLESIGETAVF